MTKHFLVSIELPDWADKPGSLEAIRLEIEQHAEAAAAYCTHAVNVSAKCELVEAPAVVYRTNP